MTLRERWNGLVGTMERPEVFYTYEWAQAVQRAYGTSLQPLLMLAYENDGLVGIVSLATTRPGKDLCFLAATTADYCDFVCSPAHRAEFVWAVFEELHRLKMPNVVLANLPAESATLHAIASTSSKFGYRLFSRPAYRCAQVWLHSSEQRESVRRSVSRKQAARRHLAAMEKVAPVKLDHRRLGNEIAPLLPDFGRAHVARCLLSGRFSNLVSAKRRVFLLELAKLLSERGWMTFSRLLVGDRAVAWNYGFQFAGSWFWYQPTFDLHWQQYSPGFCLLTKIVEEACCNEEIEIVDLGLGEEGYKDRVATASRPTVHVTAAQQWSRWAYEAVRYHVTVAIKTRPRLESWLRSGRDRLSHCKTRIRTSGLSGLCRGLQGRAKKAVLGEPEVFFFEWPEGQRRQQDSAADSLKMQELDLEILADAAMRYSDDEETLTYLFRAARRLRATSSRGFALADEEGGAPVHFCWAAPFDGFFMAELRYKLSAPSPRATLLFDCWTPVSVRGHGYYGEAISRVASRLHASGKSPWIFSSAANLASLQGVKKAGFEFRFSLTRRRMWRTPKVMTAPAAAYCQPSRDSSAA